MINQEPTPAPLDFSSLVRRMNNNAKLASILFKKFEEALPSYFPELSSSLEACDMTQIQDCAHKLKGSALTVSAPAIATAAKGLEDAAKVNSLEEVKEHMSVLTQEMDRFLAWAQTQTDLQSEFLS